MSKEDLFDVFKIMFPEWAAKASSYNKIGSRCIAITFKGLFPDEPEKECSRVFLWMDMGNWQFGTKLWRKRPERLNAKYVEDKENVKEEDVQNEE